MADKAAEESQSLRLRLQSFLSGKDETGKILSNAEKTQCAIALLHSLPCARHAVLEQLCDVFHEAVQKYMVELERQALSGTTAACHRDTLDPELISALQNVSEVVCRFVDNNPTAWAPLICQWSLNLLGQVVTKNNGRRATGITLSLSEGLHKWMLFPAVQRLMDITVHCSAKLVSRGEADVCVQCLLQIAMNSSPHLDWVVAHIGSHFHQVFIPKLLSAALKEYTASHSPGGGGGDTFVMTPTVVHVLTYLSLQHSQEVKNNLLAMFHESIATSPKSNVEREERLSTLPFLLHIATSSPDLLRGTITEFITALTPEVLLQLLEQSKKRGDWKISLVSSVVNVIKNMEEGALEVFQLLLENCQKPTDRESKEVDLAQAELQKTFSLTMGLLLTRLKDIAIERHSLFYKNTTIASLDTRKTESEFLTEMAHHTKDLCQALITSSGNKVSNTFQMLVTIAIYSGRTLAAGILNHVLLNSRSSQSLQLFVQLHCDLELYYTQLLDDVVKTCLSTGKYPGTASHSKKLLGLLSNLHELITIGSKNANLLRSKMCTSLQRHHSLLTNLLIHPNLDVSLKSLELLLSLDKIMPDKVSNMMKICSNCVGLFYKLLNKLRKQDGSISETVKSIKLCRQMVLLLSKDDRCRLYLMRLLVEGTLKKEHVSLFGGILPAEPSDSEKDLTNINVSLLERNRNPHISSHLPLTPSSVFFSGIVGNIEKNNRIKAPEPQVWQQTSQVFVDVVFMLCTCDQGDADGSNLALHHKYVDSLSLLLMELVCPDVVPISFDWPDDESLKFTIERDLRIKKTFDDNPILWALVSIVARGVSSLSKCSPLVSSLLATVMSNWEVYRGSTVDQSSLNFKVTCFITDIMTKASWLPPPLSRVGAVFGLLKPKEIYTILNTMWKVLKEFPPPSSAMTPEATRQRWQQGTAFKTQKEVVKAIFVNNIEKLGHHYARVFDESW
ncbi:integrator complex subunit 5-like [Pocillopora damicornis]|nr:integrator complex subunit 5-like [Pocillopora damicornis]